MDPDGLLYWLAQVTRQGRRQAGKKRAHYAAAADMDPSALSRFEQAKAWPRNPDQVIAGYAQVLKLEPPVLWRRALDLWELHRAGKLELTGDEIADLDLIEEALHIQSTGTR